MMSLARLGVPVLGFLNQRFSGMVLHHTPVRVKGLPQASSATPPGAGPGTCLLSRILR